MEIVIRTDGPAAQPAITVAHGRAVDAINAGPAPAGPAQGDGPPAYLAVVDPGTESEPISAGPAPEIG